MTESWDLLGIAVAALGGAAIGVERQQSGHATGPHARFGGVRTFTMLGGLSGLAGWLATRQLVGFAVVLAAGAVALVIAGYLAAARRDVDGTSEAAGLVAIAAGLAAGLGWLALASAVIALTMLLLVEKSRLHALVARIDDDEMRAAVRFGVMAIVILPILPEGPFGPWGGIRPRELWMLVLLFTGISFAGYVAHKLFGAGHGYPVAGLLAGIVSSTNATFTFSRLSRREPNLARPLAVGTVAACTMLFPRAIVAASVLKIEVARALLPYLVGPFAFGVGAMLFLWRRSAKTDSHAALPTNPLQVWPALQMAAVFQIVLFAVDWVRRLSGEGGLILSGAVLGLTDVDALTISMSRSVDAGVPAAIAAQAIAVGILANCVLKAALTATLGTAPFARLAGGVLAAMAGAIVVTLVLVTY
jgi:uncharacterized membrane protein (DUF4010 family)